MRVLSATEAINPAIEHTKALLRPFSLRLWFRLGLVACFAEVGGQFFFPPVGSFVPHGGTQQTHSIPALTPLFILIAVIAAAVGIVIGLGLLYVGSRLQLVLMDLVATRATQVAPAWRRTASRTWRWIGLKFLLFLAASVVIIALLAVPVIYLFSAPPATTGSPHPAPGLFAAMIVFFVAFAVAMFAMVFVLWILRDFILPFILFEDAPISVAIARTASILRGETGSVLLYFLLKLALGMAAGVAAELGIFLALLVLAIPLGSVGALLWFGLHQAGTFAVIVMYLSFGLLGMVFLAVLFTLLICVGGAVLIFNQTYALYFLGGRIPSLGNLLQPPPPPSPLPPPLPVVPA